MGVRYSIDLYYPLDCLENCLLKLQSICNLSQTALTKIELPNGKFITVNFDLNDRNSSVRLGSYTSGISLDTCVLFPIDEPLRAYVREYRLEQILPRKRDLISIGTIYLSIQAGLNYVKLSFTAATRDMSKLFLASVAIQDRFIEFMNLTGGLFGSIDIEQDYYLLLTDPTRQITSKSRNIEAIEVEPYYDIDLFVAECLEQL